jgi:hypothetical protein
MSSKFIAALALATLFAAPVAATASTSDRGYGARLRAEIRREIRESKRGAQRARMAARRAVQRAMARERAVRRAFASRAWRDSRRAARDARRYFWRD